MTYFQIFHRRKIPIEAPTRILSVPDSPSENDKDLNIYTNNGAKIIAQAKIPPIMTNKLNNNFFNIISTSFLQKFLKLSLLHSLSHMGYLFSRRSLERGLEPKISLSFISYGEKYEPTENFSLKKLMCPREESNLHTLASTAF